MAHSKQDLRRRFQEYYTEFPQFGLTLDLIRVDFPEAIFISIEPRLQKGFAGMAAVENGASANPEEKRMVVHYLLLNPGVAPTPELRKELEDTIGSIKTFAPKVH